MSATLTVKDIGSLLQGKSVTVGKNVLTMNFGAAPAKRGPGRPKGAVKAAKVVKAPKAAKVVAKGRGRPQTEHTLRARDIEEALAAFPVGTAFAFRAIFKAVKPSGISRAQTVKMVQGLVKDGTIKRTKGGFALVSEISGSRKNLFSLKRAGRPAKVAAAPAKRGPGRPKAAPATAKRGPGRPKGSHNKVAAAPKLNADGTPKRGPGRPKGSKNAAPEVPAASPLDNIVAAAETAILATPPEQAAV